MCRFHDSYEREQTMRLREMINSSIETALTKLATEGRVVYIENLTINVASGTQVAINSPKNDEDTD